MEMGERVAVGGLDEVMKKECPFQDEGPPEVSEEGENVARDDFATDEQTNNAGALGKNLEEGRQGAAETVKGPCPPPENPAPVRRVDTLRTGVKVFVPEADEIEGQELPFTVAAHHLIPGDASLKNSDLKIHLMTKGGSVTTPSGTVRKIKNHIGYNVNGAHNGVWLPGNYAIRAGIPPLNKTWSALEGKPDWCFNYVAAVSGKAGGQFHDAHTEYSGSVEELLNKIHAAVSAHECDACKGKSEIPPPYMVKNRLYALSEYLRNQLKGMPNSWRRPWFASDRWRDALFSKKRTLDGSSNFDKFFKLYFASMNS